MEALPEFSEIHVVSDLHLGGEPGRQIFTGTAELVALIDKLRNRPAASSVALVVNGDLVDFLAEPGATYFDPAGAGRKLDRIFADPSFAPVFDALARFIAKPRRQLVLVLGNHDLELALAPVRHQLVERLSKGKDPPRGRITTAFDGTGFVCRVGDARILCFHGNELDPWNVVDYERLRRIARDQSMDRPLRPWIPNAGTKLVIDVMNDIKARYPFVDLLKPEVEAVVPVLLALDRGQAAKLREVTAVASRLTWDSIRRMTGFLGAEEAEQTPAGARLDAAGDLASADRDAMDRLLTRTFAIPESERASLVEAQAMLSDAEDRLQRGVDPLALLEEGSDGDQLGVIDAAWSWVRRRPREEVLWRALETLKGDRSFDLYTADDLFRLADEYVGTDFDVLVTGHTHLERALPRSRGRGRYFNSGTWVRLIKLSEGQLANPASVATFLNGIAGNSLAALDAQPDLVEHRPAVVSISGKPGGPVSASLQRVSLGGAGKVVLQPVAGG